MLAFLNQVRKPTLDLPLDVRRKMWFKPFMQSYLVVFIGYLTMYLIRKNFNIAQNDMISTYGLSMTELGMIGLGFSITYGVGKTLVSYYADGKNTKQFLPFMLILSAICMLGFSASMGAGSTSLFLMIAFYALSGFFQSTGGSCSYSTITNGLRVVNAAPFSASGISPTTSAARARQAWRCSAPTTCSTVTSSACLSSRRLSR